MTRTAAKLVLALTLSLAGAPALAAAWVVPNNVRIVQMDREDPNGRIYRDLRTAINSCNGSSQSHCVVKVMPGTYNVGSALVLEPYVDVVGSGPQNTTITANVADAERCTTGAVVMANESTLRGVTVVNTANGTPDAPVFTSAALAFINVKASAQDVRLQAGAAGSNIDYVEVVCGGGEWAIVDLKDATIETSCGTSTCDLLDTWFNPTEATTMVSSFTLTNVTGTAATVSPDHSANVVHVGGNRLSMNNCSFWASGGVQARPELGSNSTVVGSTFVFDRFTACTVNMTSATIVNSRFIAQGEQGCGAGPTYGISDPSTTRIVNTQLPGDLSGLAGTKLVGDYDASFTPIPNQ